MAKYLSYSNCIELYTLGDDKVSLEYKVSFRKKDKSIQCIIAYKDGDKWKQKTKQGFKTQKEYKPWIDETVKELKNTVKVPIDFRGMTFGQFKDIFLKDKEKEYAQNSIDIYDRTYTKFKKINDVPITEVGYIHLKPCFDDMLKEGLKESTIRDYFTKLKTTFNHAIENYEIMKDNPINIKQYKFPVVEQKETKIKALTEFELNDLLSKLNGPDYYFCVFAGKCGMRLGEINGIIDDGSLDLENGVVHVKRQWKKGKKREHELGPLKTINSYRTVPIPAAYIPGLKMYVNGCVKDMNNRIFIDKYNDTTSARLSYKFKKMGYDISVHDLRHTYVTILIKNGFDFKTIAELIGDTVEMVIKTYSHFTEDMFESAKDRINKIL